MGRAFVAFLLRFLGRLRFPWLFGVVASLFVVDLIVPDLIPFADEVLLAGGTILLGAWKKRRQDRLAMSPKNATESQDAREQDENTPRA